MLQFMGNYRNHRSNNHRIWCGQRYAVADFAFYKLENTQLEKKLRFFQGSIETICSCILSSSGLVKSGMRCYMCLWEIVFEFSHSITYIVPDLYTMLLRERNVFYFDVVLNDTLYIRAGIYRHIYGLRLWIVKNMGFAFFLQSQKLWESKSHEE